MDFETEGGATGLRWPRERTLSSMSQQSSHSSKWNFPDSGLFTCSSNNSDCSAAIESDSDSCQLKATVEKDETLESALRDARRLRSELERLRKSEQWYKQELRQQKSFRLEDLEKIYTQERKFMQDNQRLQKECVRLYEKCSEFERELQKQQQDSDERIVQYSEHPNLEEGVTQFDVQQQSALIKDQQQLISVLRRQKKSLLNDLRSLTEEKDEKVIEMQRVVADLEFDNRRITKQCTKLSSERSTLESSLRQTDKKLSLAIDEKLNLHKSLVNLSEQLEVQEKLVKAKEDEIAQLHVDFKDNMEREHDLDKVHRLSMRYHEQINRKSLDIITLKSQLSNMQNELENLQDIQTQNDEQQRLIEQLNFSLEACQMELQEVKESQSQKSVQIQDLLQKTDKLLQDKEHKHMQLRRQESDFAKVCQELKITNEQYTLVQERYKETQFKLELLEIDQSKLKFQSEKDQLEIQELRQKLRGYLQHTSELGEKIQCLETDMKKAVQENVVLKAEFENLQLQLKDLKLDAAFRDSKDFLDLSTECHSFRQCCGTSNNQEKTDMSDGSQILGENTDVLEFFLKEKETENVINSRTQHSNEGMQKLVTENEILKKKIVQIENEAYVLQLKQDINEKSEKYTELKALLDQQEQMVRNLQNELLHNDSKLYKMEKQLKILQGAENSSELHLENQLLKKNLATEQNLKTDLKAQLTQVEGKLETMTESLEQYKLKQRPTTNKAVQCDMEHEQDISQEIKYLKEQIVELQDIQQKYEHNESHKKDDRLQLLHKLLEMQNSKVQSLQDSTQDCEDMLKSLNSVQTMEDQTRRELELKRMELEELNQVFGEQNEELRKLEEMAALIDFKRQHEKEQLKQTFQHELDVVKQQLVESQQEIQQQQQLNLQLQRKNDRIQQNYNEDYATEIADYRNEVRSLKHKMERSLSDNDYMTERIQELEGELKEMKHRQRHAVLVQQFPAITETCVAESLSDLPVRQCKVDEDHLRILTKVLEGEYARKMQRYDDHIHSLLANVNGLKRSLKLNEEKTAILSEEQCKTLEELKKLQKTKRNLEEMRVKYEESQTTIRNLKQALVVERNKFESSDLGKSSRNEATTYEVANLIDDYKKLIQQSASITKRAPASSILDLIQRSNQYVPNLQKLEANIGDLRCDLQNFLSSHTQKMPVTSLITAASLTVPPSLMDELRVASDAF